MVTRTKKLAAAAAVLLAGLGLAWPLRRVEPSKSAGAGGRLEKQVPAVAETPAGLATAPPAADRIPQSPAHPSVPASMTGLNSSAASLPNADATGAVAREQPPGGEAPDGRPAYALAVEPEDEAEEAEDKQSPRIHVVHNGDTLGRLAKRYLGDEGRALDIFDLNRDVLSNPHLLPIGAELRIPPQRAAKASDGLVDRSADRSAAE